jgi:hypothetical protein
MTLALERGDVPEWVRAFEETLRLGQQAMQEPTLISGLVGIAIQALAFDSAQRMLVSDKVTDQLLASTGSAIMKYPLPGLSRAIRGERILAEDAIDYVYATGKDAVEQIAGGAVMPLPKRPTTPVIPDGQALGPGMPAREELVALMGRAYDALDRLATMPYPARRAAPELQTLSEALDKSTLARMLLPATDKAFLAWDQYQADRAGTFIQVALARREFNRGTLPESLADMKPDFGGFPINDPYSGGTIGYLPPSKGPYEGGRAYVLYAAGADGIDNGGNVNFTSPHDVNKSGAEGGDYLLNRIAK